MNFEFLSRTFLFQGTSPEETQHMLSCLNAEPKNYPKGKRNLSGWGADESYGTCAVRQCSY